MSRIKEDDENIGIMKKNDERNDKTSSQEKRHEESETSPKGENQELPKEWRYAKSHPKELIISEPFKEVTIHSS